MEGNSPKCKPVVRQECKGETATCESEEQEPWDGSDLTILFQEAASYKSNQKFVFLISNFRHVLNLLCILLGVSPASDCCMPTFRNPLSVPSSRAGCRV